jgi:hypothetical protein
MASSSWAGPPAGGSTTIGSYVPSLERFYLRNTNDTGTADAGNFKYSVTAAAGDEIPLTCDWDNNGTDTIGVYMPAVERFFLRNTNDTGTADAGNFKYSVTAAAGDEFPVVGDWDGNGTCTIGVFVPSLERYYLRNTNDTGTSDAGNFKYSVTAGIGDELPGTGDWDANLSATIGSYLPSSERYYLRNSNSTGTADAGNFKYSVTAAAGDERPITGDWNADGSTTIGSYLSATERFYLRNTNDTGTADAGNFKYSVTAGAADETPVRGDWDGL